MKTRLLNRLLIITALFLSTTGISHAELKVGDFLPPKLPIIQINESIETEIIRLNLGLNGKIQSIETKECSSCLAQRFTVDKDTQYYLGNTKLKHEDLVRLNGKSGTISYYPKTMLTAHVRFFNLED